MLVALPAAIDPVAVASLSDNVADGWRTVGPQLAERPGAPVLIVGGAAPTPSPLYAAQAAVALGAERVDFLDTDPGRLALAERLGANPVEGPAPRKAGSYPITVNASVDQAGLHCAIRSTEPGGACTNVGIYFAGADARAAGGDVHARHPPAHQPRQLAGRACRTCSSWWPRAAWTRQR